MGLFDQIGVDSSIYMLAYQVGLHLRVVGGFCFSVLPVSSVRILARLMLEQWGFWGLTGLCQFLLSMVLVWSVRSMLSSF